MEGSNQPEHDPDLIVSDEILNGRKLSGPRKSTVPTAATGNAGRVTMCFTPAIPTVGNQSADRSRPDFNRSVTSGFGNSGNRGSSSSRSDGAAAMRAAVEPVLEEARKMHADLREEIRKGYEEARSQLRDEIMREIREGFAACGGREVAQPGSSSDPASRSPGGIHDARGSHEAPPNASTIGYEEVIAEAEQLMSDEKKRS